ncbi:MAG: hypothetical protein ACREJC_04125 [Tepidisphaeraceae bacterium]
MLNGSAVRGRRFQSIALPNNGLHRTLRRTRLGESQRLSRLAPVKPTVRCFLKITLTVSNTDARNWQWRLRQRDTSNAQLETRAQFAFQEVVGQQAAHLTSVPADARTRG